MNLHMKNFKLKTKETFTRKVKEGKWQYYQQEQHQQQWLAKSNWLKSVRCASEPHS
jgi:hypothetical protein